MAKISKNIFSKGLNRDYDPTNVNAYSMVDNINGKLMFNENGTLDWVEDNGNKYSFSLNANSGNDSNRYVPIGYAGDGNIKVIFSVREDLSASEIGILGTDTNGIGTYKTLFNDTAQTEKLNFNPQNQITARFLYENDKTIRVYWVDGVESTSNPPRVFTFEHDSTKERNDVTSYSAVTSSAHSIDSQAEFNQGIIKYKEKINGSLFTGVYQYTYRLITNDGYSTPWVTPTKKILLTSDEISSSNWNTYEMEGSGIAAGKGNRVIIKGIDTRFKSIEVAYLYSKANSVIHSSNIFIRADISAAEEEFDHTVNDGEPVGASQIAQKFQGISSAKTLDIKDSVLYYGNINENKLSISDTEIEAVLTNLSITPKFRLMTSDLKRYDTTTGFLTAPPITHQTPYTNTSSSASNTITTTTKRLHQNWTEEYDIKNDYQNYKGTQVENLYTGYFRGEVYRFAIVFYDKIGNPYFAFHLADFKFPDQYQTAYSWRRLRQNGTIRYKADNLAHPATPTNDYVNLYLGSGSDRIDDSNQNWSEYYSFIRVMGIEVGGIDISGIQDKISGFSIVRTDRHKTILHQGIVLPVVSEGNLTRPLPTAHQRIDANNHELFGVKVQGSSGNRFGVRPNQSVLHVPDHDFDESTIPTIQSNDRLKIVGSCYKETNKIATLSGDPNPPISNGSSFNHAHFTYLDTQPGHNGDMSPCIVSKWYRSYNIFHVNKSGTENLYPAYGNYAKLVYQLVVGRGETIADYETGLTFENQIKVKTDDWAGGADGGNDGNTEGFGNGDNYYGWGKTRTLLYKHEDWSNGSSRSAFKNSVNTPQDYVNASTAVTYLTQAGALICNYTRNQENQLPDAAYGGLTKSSLEQTVYYSTGHYQPVNHTSFNNPTGTWIYNQIEVFGGDCYLDYFGFIRMYGNINSGSGGVQDVSYGIVFPLESENNYSLRQAQSTQNPMYTDVGARPGKQLAGSTTNFPNGLFTTTTGTFLREEFNYNDVLTFSELTTFFASPPIGFQDVNEYPVRWRHTLNKYYGDTVDTWRQFETNLYEDINGVHGAITSSTFMFNQIYSFQETAFGRLRAFDRAALESETTGSLTTGVGPALDGIDYISTSVGNQHQWSLVNTGKAAYWIDVFNGKAMRFAQDGLNYLSDLRGMHFYFEKESSFFLNKDNPANNNGILGAWNSKDREVLWTFNRDEYLSTLTSRLIVSEISDPTSLIQLEYKNNETVFINWTGSTYPNGLTLPIGETTTYGVNKNVIQYVSLKLGSNPLNVKERTDSTVNSLVDIQPGENYMFYRESSTDSWSFILLADKSKITPFRATVVYSEYVQGFSQFHSFKPNFYISHNKFLFSENGAVKPRDFYVHGTNLNRANYYGEDWKTSLNVTVSDQGEFAKLFDSVRVAVNKQGVDKMDKFIFSTEQQKSFYNVQSDTRVRFLEDNFRMPIRTQTQQDRMRGRWLSMIFEFSNNTAYPIKIDNLINHYRLSNRK